MIVESSEDVIKLSGPIRMNFWETIQTAIALTLQRHPSGVIVDCANVTELTEEGAATFQAAIDFVLEHEDARIIFVAVPDQVKEVMRQAPQVRSQMVLLDNIGQARRSLDLLADAPKTEERKTYDRQILTCLFPTAFDHHILDVTLELVSDLPAKVILLLPIVVPREHPLQASMPESEERVDCFAEKAKTILAARNVPYDIRLERTRDLASLIAETAEEVDAAHVLVSIAPSHKQDEAMTKVLKSILNKVNRSVLFVRKPIDEPFDD